MAEEYANIVFDEFYRPSDALEDALAAIETKALPAFDRMIKTSSLDCTGRVDLAYFLAVQACRYPELYASRLDLGRYLAIALKDCSKFQDVAPMNRHLQGAGILPGANFSEDEFKRLTKTPDHELAAELHVILASHGYEAYFNAELVVAAALPVAEHLLGLEWHLLEAPHPAFILSDRPMPVKIGHHFSVGLSSTFGLQVRYPGTPVTDGTISARAATTAEVDGINHEVRARAREWICGSGAWIQNL